MKKHINWAVLWPIYGIVLVAFVMIAFWGSRAVTVISENRPIDNRKCVVIDAGHGGVDGGATSCTGILESSLNLEIALRLEDLMHLLGIDTYMIRRTDCSVYTQGNTIAAKKVSDLRQRVKLVNEIKTATLISIHQNNFTDSRYSGAQVFYAPTENSDALAKQLQSDLIQTLNPGSNRQAKRADGVYLMQHITCTGVLVECGFLSNHEEEAKLRNEEYQKKLCCVLAVSVSNFLDQEDIG